MTKAMKDLCCGIALMLFSAFIWIFSLSIRQMKTATYDVSSALFPRICAVLLLILGAILALDSARKLMKEKGATTERTAIPAPDLASVLRIVIAVAALVLFTLCLKKVGFILCGSALQFILMLTLAPPRLRDMKHILLWLAISIAFAVLIDWLFVRVFRLMLPGGILTF